MGAGRTRTGLRALAEGSASALLVRGVPDARVREHVRAYELVLAGGDATDAAAVRALAARDAGGIAPEALFALADELARGIEVRPGASGTLDVLFHPAAGVAHFPAAVDAERPWESYANDPQWGRRMRALVPALREAARARLPEYMVPSAFVVLESFPVTANGKVDRGALPAPDTPGSRGGTYVAPRTPAEERMAGIWAEVLGVERVGAEDHFFDLGGHSLLATQLVSRVREAFRTELPLRAVFEAPTLAELARRVEALRAETPGDAGAPPLVPVPRDGSPLPLSFAQQRLWFIDQLEPGSTAYHMPSALRLRGRAGPRARWSARSSEVVARGTRRCAPPSRECEGVPLQVVRPGGRGTAGAAGPVAPARGAREAEAALGAWRRSGRGAVRPARGAAAACPPAAPGGRTSTCCCWRMHHVVSDGWSMGVLFARAGARSTRRSRAARRRRCRSCRCSTPTTPCGSAPGWAARPWRRRSAYWTRDAGRRAGAAGAADGPPAPGAAGLRRCVGEGGAGRGVDRGAQGAVAAARDHAVHDAAGRAGRLLLAPAVRAGRRGGGHARSPGARAGRWRG